MACFWSSPEAVRAREAANELPQRHYSKRSNDGRLRVLGRVRPQEPGAVHADGRSEVVTAAEARSVEQLLATIDGAASQGRELLQLRK